MNLFNRKNNLKLGLTVFLISLMFFLDKALGAGAVLLIFLSIATFFVVKRNKDRKILVSLFLIAFAIHVAAVLFMHYTNFQPFSGGGGDYIFYDSVAQEIANRVHSGNFSLEGLSIGHYYPVVVGYLYFLTMPSMLIGRLFNAWIAALSVIFVYLIVRKIGGSEKQGFFAGIIASIYPSFLFYGSLLVKDPFVVLLCLIGLLLMLKIIEEFSWKNFLIFYIILGCLFHFRFYIGSALLLAFIVCWLLFSNLKIKKRIVYGAAIIFVLGFLPQITTGQGYYGTKFLKQYLNVATITFYRETAYSAPKETSVPTSSLSPTPSLSPTLSPAPSSDQQSSVVVEAGFENPLKFVKNTLISFSYSFLGPFPWQMKHLRHILILAETIAWYILLFFIVKGIIKSVKNYRLFVPLIIFSLIVLFVLALFISNFGIITRIRIPAFISLLCLAPFGINWMSENKIIKTVSKSLDFLIKL